ncbi:aa3-type cytochrome oxidase subunit IV [Streptomyces sp. NPDC002851]
MRTEARLFALVAAFFGATAIPYWWFSRDPAGTAALVVAFLMALLVTIFLSIQHLKRGMRPEDRRNAEIKDRGGPLDFFPPRSAHPPLAALGVAVMALGVVYGLWLFLIGTGVLAGAVYGFVFQHAQGDE